MKTSVKPFTNITAIASVLLLNITLSITLFGCNDTSSSVSNEPSTKNNSPKKSIAEISTKKNSTSELAQLEIINPSNFVRKDEPVYLSYYDLGLTDKVATALNMQVFNDDNLLASQQIDSDHDGKKDGLYFLIDLVDNSPQSVVIKTNDDETTGRHSPSKKRVQAEISHKINGQWQAHSKLPTGKAPKNNADTTFQEYVGGEFVNVNSLTPPAQYTDHSNWIRYEGPGIESDQVGYRIYLDWRNGFDIFGKLTKAPILQQVGQDGYQSYHQMQSWGMDILKVGNSLGAGGFGLIADAKKPQLEHVADVESRQAVITDNGNIHASMQLNYHHWQNSINKQDLQANISMHAGSRLAQVDLALTKDLPNMVAGIVKHENTQFIKGDLNISGHHYSYIASWGQQGVDNSLLGMAVFFKKGDLIKITEDEKNYLAMLKPQGQSGNKQLEYYFASVWQGESNIDNQADFTQYLQQTAEKLTRKPRIALKTKRTTKATEEKLTADRALAWGKALADSELARKALGYHYHGWDVNRQRTPKFEYDIVGIQPLTFDLLADLSGDNKYRQVITQVTGSFVTDDGDILAYNKHNYNIDNIPPGRNFLRLYQRTKDEKYRKAASVLRQQLAEHPKTSQGAYWHKKKYTNQVWLDGVYMGMPFLAEYALMFESGHQQQESLNEVVNEFKLVRAILRDAKTGLYYHGWDEAKQQDWADKNTGLSSQFWARGLGWLAMAIVDVLDSIPEQQLEQRQFLLNMVNELAVSIAKTQDQATGTWWQIMDKPAQVGNYKESSATAMFSYFYAKAINNGYLASQYRDLALSAFQGLIKEFTLVHADGSTSMTNQCYVAGLGFGRDGSYRYYMNEPISQNDPKGTSPYILASMEIYQLLQAK